MPTPMYLHYWIVIDSRSHLEAVTHELVLFSDICTKRAGARTGFESRAYEGLGAMKTEDNGSRLFNTDAPPRQRPGEGHYLKLDPSALVIRVRSSSLIHLKLIAKPMLWRSSALSGCTSVSMSSLCLGLLSPLTY